MVMSSSTTSLASTGLRMKHLIKYIVVLLLCGEQTRAFHVPASISPSTSRLPKQRPSLEATRPVELDVQTVLELIYPKDGDHVRAEDCKASYLSRVRQGEVSDELVLVTSRALTYGEFPVSSLATLLSEECLGRAVTLEDVFVDLGCGNGRLVLAVASLGEPWRLCAGVEIVPGLAHSAAVLHRRAVALQRSINTAGRMTACTFLHANIEAAGSDTAPPRELIQVLRSATVLFTYCTTWKTSDGFHLDASMGSALAKWLRPDAVLITTDKRLPPHGAFEVFKEVRVWNPEVGGESICHYHRLRGEGTGRAVESIEAQEARDLFVSHGLVSVS